MNTDPSLTYVGEFFAGIGLARLGLEEAGFRVNWSNDISRKKEKMFHANFDRIEKDHTYELADVRDLDVRSLSGRFQTAWASFPCKDLSLAGGRGGLHVGSSSAFWSFVQVLSRMKEDRPRVLVIENVTAFATSRLGKDLFAAIQALNGLGYSVDIISLDARRFLPQSRPRVFLIADIHGQAVGDQAFDSDDSEVRPTWLDSFHKDPRLRTHRLALPSLPPLLEEGFTDLAESIPEHDAEWWDASRLESFKTSLSSLQLARLVDLSGGPTISRRTAFRRMRNGVPRWEIRRDDIAGCLRTSSGGSSRQAVVEAGLGKSRVRWMSQREYALLMGAGDYRFDGLPVGDVLSGFGDAVCVPVVRWIADHYIRVLLGMEVADTVVKA